MQNTLPHYYVARPSKRQNAPALLCRRIYICTVMRTELIPFSGLSHLRSSIYAAAIYIATKPSSQGLKPQTESTMAPSARASSFRPPSATEEEVDCKHLNQKVLLKQAFGRWSQGETGVLIAEWKMLRRRGRHGGPSDFLGLNRDDWFLLTHAVNAYRASAGHDSVRTYRQCKGHLRYVTEREKELNACGAAAAGLAWRGSSSASESEGHSVTSATAKKCHDAATETEPFWGHDAGASGLGGRIPRRPRTGLSNSSFTGCSSQSVKEELKQQAKGRGGVAVHGTAPASANQLFAMAAGSADAAVMLALADAYMKIRITEIEQDRAAGTTKKEAAKGSGRAKRPSMN